jgi:hypothetical protein
MTPLPALRQVAEALGPDLCERVVFLGGATASLMLSEPRAQAPRPTDDVDAVAKVPHLPAYYALQDQLKARGFLETPEAGVVCRFRRDDLVLDLMPTDPAILGFTNPWYEYAHESAQRIALASDRPGQEATVLRIVTPACFVATKLAAYAGRGGGDLFHPDIEDIISVVDGRPSLLAELMAERSDLRAYIQSQIKKLIADGLEDKVAGHLPGDSSSQARVPRVTATLRQMAHLTKERPAPAETPLPATTFLWTLHAERGDPSTLYVNCWFEARQRDLEPFLVGNRAPVSITSLPDGVRSALEQIWSAAKVTIASHVDGDQPYRRAFDHLAREPMGLNRSDLPDALQWSREMEVPNGRSAGPSGRVQVSSALGPLIEAVDAAAKRIATERVKEAIAARRAWDDA